MPEAEYKPIRGAIRDRARERERERERDRERERERELHHTATKVIGPLNATVC